MKSRGLCVTCKQKSARMPKTQMGSGSRDEEEANPRTAPRRLTRLTVDTPSCCRVFSEPGYLESSIAAEADVLRTRADAHEVSIVFAAAGTPHSKTTIATVHDLVGAGRDPSCRAGKRWHRAPPLCPVRPRPSPSLAEFRRRLATQPPPMAGEPGFVGYDFKPLMFAG